MLMRPDSGSPKMLVMYSNSRPARAANSGGSGLALVRDVDVDVADAGGGDGRDELAGNDGAGKAGLGPGEAEFAAAVGQGFAAGRAAADGGVVGGDADVHVGGEAVGEEAGHGEPAAGVEQDADGVGDGG